MAKSTVLGNGQLLVGLDAFGQVYDLYFPFVGTENHMTGEYVHKIGVFISGKFHWLDDGSWKIDFNFNNNNVLEDRIIAVNEDLKVKLEIEDVVYNEKDIFLREIKVHNLAEFEQEIKLYINHQFQIYESKRGDTAYYDPTLNSLVHYKGRRNFLINARHKGTENGFDDYSVGLFKIEGKEGTYKDAEDGDLSQSNIEHGLVDSVIGLYQFVPAGKFATYEYWMCVGKSIKEIHKLNQLVFEKGFSYILKSTKDYWNAWLHKEKYDFSGLSDKSICIFYKSLEVCRVHADNMGGIIASSDMDLLKQGRDAYSYVWPRDASFITMAMTMAGYTDISRRFFDFCLDIITEEGYFMHKYRSDGSLGSSWHPHFYNGEPIKPIQLDETALVIIAIKEYYGKTKDVEYIEKIYNSLIKKSVDFLISCINRQSGEILQSYDLWEENFGVSTFTASAVYKALLSASYFASIFGKEEKSLEYKQLSILVKNWLLSTLFNADTGLFVKHMSKHGDLTMMDPRVDSSTLYALHAFGILESNDQKILDFKKLVYEKIWMKKNLDGFARYENDNYFRVSSEITGNPWIITKLWVLQLEIKNATKIEDLDIIKKEIDGIALLSTKGGMLPEQINIYTGEALSATPLVWSHGEFIVTVLELQKKIQLLEKNS